MHSTSNKKGKRTGIHPERSEVLKKKNAVYVITCPDESFSCISHDDGCGRGFFSLFLQAVYGIYFSAKMGMPCYVDYGNLEYRYSDKQLKDSNFWNYYFVQSEPIANHHKVINHSYEVYPIRIWAASHFSEMHREVVSRLVWKEEVWSFIKSKTEVFKQKKILGLHIRKTDHFNELTPVSFDQYIKRVKKIIDRFDKLFIATDDRDVLHYFQTHYPEKLIYHNVHRSSGTMAIHSNKDLSDRYALGMEALLDCYSLSLCEKVILSPSNLSYAACLFNPQLNYVLMESRQAKWKRFKILLLYYLHRWNIRKW